MSRLMMPNEKFNEKQSALKLLKELDVKTNDLDDVRKRWAARLHVIMFLTTVASMLYTITSALLVYFEIQDSQNAMFSNLGVIFTCVSALCQKTVIPVASEPTLIKKSREFSLTARAELEYLEAKAKDGSMVAAVEIVIISEMIESFIDNMTYENLKHVEE